MISQKTRASLTVIISFIVVILGTVLLVAVASGYNIDFLKGEISSRGLVKLSTNPTGATIKINSKQIRQKTPYQLDSVKIGPLKVEYEKQGYHSWSSNFLVEGGVVTFADYALLIPNEIETKQIDSSQIINDFVSNPDNSKVFVTTENSGQLIEVQRNSQLKKTAELPLNASFKPASKLSENITNDEGSVVLTKAIYPDSKAIRFWVSTTNGSTVNLDEIIGEDTVNLAINPRNSREVFGLKVGQLVRADIDSRQNIKIGPTNISSLLAYKGFIYTLENLTPASNGQFLVRYDLNGGGRYVLAQYPPLSKSPWQIKVSKLNGTDYITLNDPSNGALYVVKNDGQKIISSLIGENVRFNSFNNTGRFLSYYQANSLKTIDLEYVERFSVTNENVRSLAWFTDYQLILSKADGPYITDFSGENTIKLPPNLSDSTTLKLSYISPIKSIYFISAGKLYYYSLQPKGSLINF
jgi:hypothetical protein